MRAVRCFLAAVILLGLAGCGSTKATTMPYVTGKKLDVAKSAIKDAGFDDKIKVDGGGIFGVIKESNWRVCKQSPAAGKIVTGTPRLKVARSCNNGSSTSSESPASKPTSSETPQSDTDQVLTVRNSPELTRLLKTGDDDAVAKAFAKQFDYRTIEFDGYIADVARHDDTQSRFDFLLYAGNAPEGGGSGPAFQMRDVGALEGVMPTNSHHNQNVHIVAKVEGFDPDTSLFYLRPVSVKQR